MEEAINRRGNINKEDKEGQTGGGAEERKLTGGAVQENEKDDRVGDESEMAAGTLQQPWTSIRLPPPLPFLPEPPPLPPRGTTPRCISALSAATTFTLREDESAEGSAATPTRGGSQRRSGRRVILSL